MNRRTQRLTARELEVLDLVRVGLTNDEIAERLGITSDGVKYHVSQILSKLGVLSRQEAADLVFEQRRSRWQRLLTPLGWSLAAKALAVAATAVVLAGVAVLGWALIASGGPGDDGTSLPQNIDQVYERALTSLSRPGFVLHATVTYPQATTRAGATVTPKSELWLDGEADAARIHWTGITEGYPDESEFLVVGQYEYLIHRPLNPGDHTTSERETFKQLCPGTDRAVIGLIFACYGQVQQTINQASPQATPSIEQTDFEGHQTVAVIGEATQTSGQYTVTQRQTLYLDPITLLPIANAGETLVNGAPTVSNVGRYVNEFLERNQVASDFFDPHSVGYGLQNAAQLLDALAQKTPIYWLGEEPNFDATVCTVPHAGSCPLVLEHVNSSPQSGARGQLAYSYGDVTIEYWPPGYLDELRSSRIGQMLEDTRCAKKSETEVGGRTAVIYVLTPITYPLVTPQRNDSCYPRFDSSGGGPIYDGAVGYVDYGDVVVEVDGPEPGVYVSRQAIEALLNALQRR